MKADTKRQNFNVTPEREAEFEELQRVLQSVTAKDAILRAVRFVNSIAGELHDGKSRYVGDAERRDFSRVIVPEIEQASNPYKYLARRPHAWRNQLALKGRRVLPSEIYYQMKPNNLSVEDVMEGWELVRDGVNEIIDYCEANVTLLEMEAAEELIRLGGEEAIASRNSMEQSA